LSSANFVTQSNWSDGNVTYLVVGGGGGGGKVTPIDSPWATAGSGGGGGGVRYGTTPVTGVNTTVAVVVGAGGLDATDNSPNIAGDGGPSSFGTPITAGGGGHGGSRAAAPAQVAGAGLQYGGSGGGATWANSPGGAGPDSTPHPGGIDAASPSTQGFGHAGQNVGPPAPYAGGGGGGAGGAGGAGDAYGTSLKGGVGARYTIQNGITGNAPDAFYYGGGGGGGLGQDGGTPYGSPDGTGGAGGDNSPHTAATNGQENRGGGGGGGAMNGTSPGSIDFSPAGKGGSGIVLIAYPS
jgi:hypothetical protein